MLSDPAKVKCLKVSSLAVPLPLCLSAGILSTVRAKRRPVLETASLARHRMPGPQRPSASWDGWKNEFWVFVHGPIHAIPGSSFVGSFLVVFRHSAQILLPKGGLTLTPSYPPFWLGAPRVHVQVFLYSLCHCIDRMSWHWSGSLEHELPKDRRCVIV